jgi:hypothetical protein
MKIYYELNSLNEGRSRGRNNTATSDVALVVARPATNELIFQRLTYPSNLDIKLHVGDKVDLSGAKSRSIVTLDNVETFKMIESDFEYENRLRWMEDKRNDNVTWEKMVEVCRPAFDINAMSLDEENKIIYSQGRDSYTAKVTGSNTMRIDMVKHIPIGSGYITLLGGFNGMETIEPFNDVSVTKFVNAINAIFH